ncbi:alpha/beta fold hydrolase [Streptomyces sp. NPDC054887]
MRVLPFSIPLRSIPLRPPWPPRLRLSAALLKATALEVAILAGHLVLYPSGIAQERRHHPAAPPDPDHGQPGQPVQPGHPVQPGQPGHPVQPLRTEPAATRAVPAEAVALPDGRGPDRPPVVLLHGFVDNRSVFVVLRRSLARHGWHHLESLNYSPLTCDIRTAAELLGRHVEEICARTGHARVDVVGHSLGGLIARYYVQRLGGDVRVRTLVTLGTPHAGTAVAPPMSAHPLVRQMRPGSDVIEELRRPATSCRTRFVSFWSDLDQLMLPVTTARLSHPDLVVQNIQVTGIGHLALPVHPAVAAGIRQALEEQDAAAGASDTVSVA